MEQTENKTSRRGFLGKAVGVIIGLQVLILSFSFFRSKSSTTEKKDKWIDLGHTDQFENGKTYGFPDDKLFLHRTKDGAFLAMSSKCTHLGCAVTMDTETYEFVCPCHASQFSSMGNATKGPAKRALNYYPIKINGDKISVDLGSTQKRQEFKKEQLTVV
ncbi:MAG: ubiquinol-cytochrome c reductase iron-sulfur subunit [Bacteroidales bacterium]